MWVHALVEQRNTKPCFCEWGDPVSFSPLLATPSSTLPAARDRGAALGTLRGRVWNTYQLPAQTKRRSHERAVVHSAIYTITCARIFFRLLRLLSSAFGSRSFAFMCVRTSVSSAHLHSLRTTLTGIFNNTMFLDCGFGAQRVCASARTRNRHSLTSETKAELKCNS